LENRGLSDNQIAGSPDGARRAPRVFFPVFSLIFFLSLALNGSAALAQTEAHHQHGPAHGASAGPEAELATDFGSGTSWQPAATQHFGWMQMRGSWTFSEHFNLFATFDREGGERSVAKFESMNFFMLMQERDLGHGGRLLFREMLSAESLTAPHGGFPQLFQTGETYHGFPIVDRQHPHDVFSELSATYMHELGSDAVRGFLYAAAAGEPALGPTAYVHRGSAAELPQAPLSHHLQDSTHISYGVFTGGVELGHGTRYDVRGVALKLEASIFNGREPDEARYTMDFAALDSWSARASVRFSDTWAAQYSYGHLVRPEAAEPGNIQRQTASLHYTRALSKGEWANSLIWGRNQKSFATGPQNGFVLESLWRHQRESLFTRLELVDKDELFPGVQTYPPTLNPATAALAGHQFRIGAFTFGGVHDLLQHYGVNLGLGADVTFYSKPSTLDDVYGAQPIGFQVFLRVRPAAMHMH
jgi:hypothetical protein